MIEKDRILAILNEDARFTAAQIAAMLACEEAEAAAAIRALEADGTVIGYKTLIDWDRVDAERVTALIEVKITPQKGMGFDELARQVSSHPQVESVYLMSGGFDLTVIINGRSMREVARFVSEQLAPTENVLSTATHFILKKYKDQGVSYADKKSDEREVLM